MTKKLEDAISNPEIVPTVSRGEQIAHEMTCAGFTLTKEPSRNYIEYRKVYADSAGTNGMVTALFRKDDASVEPAVLEGFVMTVQKHVRAIPEDIDEHAWKFARADMRHLVDVIGASDEPSAEVHIVMSKCDDCSANSTDSIPFGKKKLCKECWDKVGI
jgi:hypothetical protein